MTKQITIIAPTFNHGRKVNIFLDSLLEQHGYERDWKCILLHDGSIKSKDEAARKSAADLKSRIHPYLKEFPDEIRCFMTGERANQWGHNLRAIGLKRVDTPYVHFTNVDNQFCYGWLERVVPVLLAEDPDLVYWPCAHSYTEFEYFDPELKQGKIDFCNYVLKTSVAKSLGFPWRNFEADGAQIETLTRLFPEAKVIRLRGIFTTHN